MNQMRAIAVHAAVWFAIGMWLFGKGIYLTAIALKFPTSTHFLKLFVAHSIEKGAMTFIALALFLGFLKSRLILQKTVKRGVEHVMGLELPITWRKLYPLRSFIVIFIMMALGISLRLMGTPNDVRAFIIMAVGSALIFGAIRYLRYIQYFKAKSR